MRETIFEYEERRIREELAKELISVEDALIMAENPFYDNTSWGIGAQIALKILAAEVVRLREVKG